MWFWRREKRERVCGAPGIPARPAPGIPLDGRDARRSIGDRKIVKIKVAWIGKTKEPAIQALTDEYLKRISRYAEVAGLALKDEAAILSLAAGGRQRQQKERHKLVLLDSRGSQFSSEELAGFLESEQVNATPLLFAIGGSDGFSEEARRQSRFTLSLGRMTLPHELARVVLVEQLYRAFTILKHHPYHLGH
jgi:23S rRNA (pseudouridine1915-N3)-methyltransferase